jgi:hypothetical protein
MPRKATEAAATVKTAAKKTTTRRTKKATEPIVLNWEDVATRAYYIHLEEGGDAQENWMRAEHELAPA